MTRPVHRIEGYVHHDGRIGVLVEFGLDFESSVGTEGFARFAKDVAMHIAARAPASVADLLDQPFVRDESMTLRQLVQSASRELRDPVSVIRFVRWDTASGHDDDPMPPRSPAVIKRMASG